MKQVIFSVVAILFSVSQLWASPLCKNTFSQILRPKEAQQALLPNKGKSEKTTEQAFLQESFYVDGKPDIHWHKDFFDKNGVLKPSSFEGFQLAVENGKDLISGIRVHLPAMKHSLHQGFSALKEKESYAAEVFRSLLMDIAPLLQKQEQIKLYIVYPNGNLPLLEKVLHDIFSSHFIQKRVVQIEHPERLNEVQPWAQDDSKPLAHGHRLVIPGLDVLKKQDKSESINAVIGHLERSQVFPVSRSSIDFEGGNLVVGSRHIFVGVETLLEIASRLNISIEKAKLALEYEFSKPIFMVGKKSPAQYPEAGRVFTQMEFHSDLTLAVGINHHTGKEIVFLASAKAAVRAYKKELKKISKNSEYRSSMTKEELSLAQYIFARDFSIRNEHNKQLKKQLEDAGYDVVEVPSFRIDSEAAIKLPEYINYVNVVFSGKQAIVPELRLPYLDSVAHKVFEQQGYEVIGASQSSRAYLKGCGGPRCAMSIFR